jgi:hypothetical protein
VHNVYASIYPCLHLAQNLVSVGDAGGNYIVVLTSTSHRIWSRSETPVAKAALSTSGNAGLNVFRPTSNPNRDRGRHWGRSECVLLIVNCVLFLYIIIIIIIIIFRVNVYLPRCIKMMIKRMLRTARCKIKW